MVQTNYEFKSNFNEKYSLLSRRILRMLSENARASVSDISKAVGVSRRTVAERIRKLQSEVGVSYTLELNEDALGLINPHLILVKFGVKPDYEQIRSVLQRSHVVQFAAVIKGNYDMLIYANTSSRREYVHWDKSTQIRLAGYNIAWYPSEVAHRQLGFFPLRNETIERMEIQPKYKEMLKLLNMNSRASFQELSKKLGMHFNTLAYNFRKLQGKDWIKRFTISMKPIPDTTIMSFFGKYVLSNSFEKDAAKERLALQSDDEQPLVSRYPFCCQLIGSQDFFALGVFDNQEIAYKNGLLYYKKSMAGQKVKVVYGTISEVLVGSMPLRSIDNKKNYNVIKWIVEEEEDRAS